MNNAVNCPVENVVVNEVRVRIIAFLVLLSAILFLLINSWIIIAFLLVDFVLRAFNYTSYSPVSLISGVIVKRLKLKNKPVDRAPKRFAAIMGTVFLTTILATLIMGHLTASKIITIILIVFASLESLVGFCAGCYVYTFLKRVRVIS